MRESTTNMINICKSAQLDTMGEEIYAACNELARCHTLFVKFYISLCKQFGLCPSRGRYRYNFHIAENKQMDDCKIVVTRRETGAINTSVQMITVDFKFIEK